ncbi:MAG: hypothetical protein HY795_10835 [Desulfovibrio sp.]|nr:hypothetical protein [Desulfovibrio sp.]MBI4959796.1 hypothetical protein [Desulfovibrio sp.]
MRKIIALLFALAAMAASCSGSSGAEGKYVAQGADGKIVTLTLKAGFTGEWETHTDAVSVRWEARGSEIWLHSKGGGVLRGVWSDGALRIALPGEGELVFVRPGAKSGG